MQGPYFLAIWVKPKETIREISEKNPNYRLGILSWILGSIILFHLYHVYFSPPFLYLLFLVLLAPVVGYLCLNIASYFVFLTGKWIKGQATFKKVRCVMAWSCVPFSVSVVLWFLLFGFFPQFFISSKGILSDLQIYVLLAITLAQVGFTVWAAVLYMYGLSEIQKYSTTHALINIVMAFLVFLFFMFLIGIAGIYVWASLLF